MNPVHLGTYGPDDAPVSPVSLESLFVKCETLKRAATFGCAGCTLHKPQGTSHSHGPGCPGVLECTNQGCSSPAKQCSTQVSETLFLTEDTEPRIEVS